MKRATLLALVALVAACQGRDPASLPDVGEPQVIRDEPAVVTEARSLFPRTLDMHQKIVARSCSPNTGVCHNTSNYPDLSTPGAMLQTIGSWCNLEIPDPTQGYDLCERPGDFLVIGDQGELVTEIAYVVREGINRWRLGTRDPIETAIVDSTVYFYDFASEPVLLPAADWLVLLDAEAGAREVLVTVDGTAENPFIETYLDEVLASLVGGDPNRNGTFGADVRDDADSEAKVINPGSLAKSYLWGRITGTVPGSRMPLANDALTDAEYVAVACFIETLGARGADVDVEDEIDYDNCAFAKDPVSYSVLEGAE